MKNHSMAQKIAVLLAAAALLFCACGKQPTWQEQYDLGVNRLSEKNYEDAVAAFTAAIELDSQNPQGYIGRGDAYAQWGESLGADGKDGLSCYQLAAEDYRVALALADDAATQKKLDETEQVLLVHSEHTHDWVGATFKEAGVCSICGLTGEPNPDYFAQNSVDVLSDCPQGVPFTYVIYDDSDPEQFRIRDDGVLTVIEHSVEPDQEPGYSVVLLSVQMDVEVTYEKETKIEMSALDVNFTIGDLYTGAEFPEENQLEVSGYDNSCQVEVDGETYDVAFTTSVDGAWQQWVADDAGDESSKGQIIWTVTARIPDGYDGLVARVTGYDALPDQQSGAAPAGLLLDMTNGHALKGSVFFRFGPPAAAIQAK